LKSYNDDRDTFYNRHNIARPVSQNNTQTQDRTADSSDWHEIKKVTSRKFVNGTETFLVWWKDGTKTREPASNITDYAKELYFISLRNKNRRRR